MGHPEGNVERRSTQPSNPARHAGRQGSDCADRAGGAGWAFADEDLEDLAPTQKQLLRMGPAHADALKVWLRALQAALSP